MSKTMKIMATRKNFTGNRCGRVAVGDDAALVGRVLGDGRVARPEQLGGHPAERAEHEGEHQHHEDRQVLGHRVRPSCPASFGLGLVEVLLQRLVPVVQQQHEHDEQREADHEVDRRQQPHVAEVTHEHDRHDRLGRVDDRDRRGLALLGLLRDHLLHLHHRVVGRVLEVDDLVELVLDPTDDVVGDQVVRVLLVGAVLVAAGLAAELEDAELLVVGGGLEEAAVGGERHVGRGLGLTGRRGRRDAPAAEVVAGDVLGQDVGVGPGDVGQRRRRRDRGSPSASRGGRR